jgi:GNAT superfamily N-acetyltransferase
MTDREQQYQIIFRANPAKTDSAALYQGLTDYARQTKSMDPVEYFGYFVKDENDQVLAGCTGALVYGCVHTDTLWVSEPLRGQGIGTRLLASTEQFAREKNCTMATINTMDWEALELYQSLGYRVDLARDGYANNSTMYFLKKAL